jgi:serine/threonine-protein kinase RsbW
MGFRDMVRAPALAGQAGGSHCGPVVELQQSLPSRVEAISPFLDQLMLFIRKFRNADGSEFDIEIALREALTNAIVHGNHEDPEKRVYVTSHCGQDGEVSITIRDQGQGFDNRAVPDPTAPENTLSPHGRGIYLVQALMDEVRFEEGGTVVNMRKKPNASSSAQRKGIKGVTK